MARAERQSVRHAARVFNMQFSAPRRDQRRQLLLDRRAPRRPRLRPGAEAADPGVHPLHPRPVRLPVALVHLLAVRRVEGPLCRLKVPLLVLDRLASSALE